MSTPAEHKPIVAVILRDAGFDARIENGQVMVGLTNRPVTTQEVLEVLDREIEIEFDAHQVGNRVRVD